MQNVFEAPAFLANPIPDRHRQRLDEQFIGVDGAAAHLGNFTHVDMITIKRRVEETQAFCFPLGRFGRRGARENQHLARHLGGRDPDLLSRKHIVVASANGVGNKVELRKAVEVPADKQ